MTLLTMILNFYHQKMQICVEFGPDLYLNMLCCANFYASIKMESGHEV